MRLPIRTAGRPDHALDPPENLGSLDRVKRVIKVLGMVNCTADFPDHPKVINGCSELFAQVWGDENGIGARSAVGTGSLPGNIPSEIEAIFEIETCHVRRLAQAGQPGRDPLAHALVSIASWKTFGA